MKKLKLLKSWKNGKKGDTIVVDNNIAHSLIEDGVATVKVIDSYSNKMLKSSNKIIKRKRKWR